MSHNKKNNVLRERRKKGKAEERKSLGVTEVQCDMTDWLAPSVFLFLVCTYHIDEALHGRPTSDDTTLAKVKEDQICTHSSTYRA